MRTRPAQPSFRSTLQLCACGSSEPRSRYARTPAADFDGAARPSVYAFDFLLCCRLAGYLVVLASSASEGEDTNNGRREKPRHYLRVVPIVTFAGATKKRKCEAGRALRLDQGALEHRLLLLSRASPEDK